MPAASEEPFAETLEDAARPARLLLLDDGNRRSIYGADGSPLSAVEGNGALEVYHRDGLGSVRAVTKPETGSGPRNASDPRGHAVPAAVAVADRSAGSR